MGMVLVTTSCTMLWTSIHSPSGTLSTWSNPLNLFVTSTVFDLIRYFFQVIPELPSGFLCVLHFKSEFCNKKLMIWAKVSSKSYFCRVYRASPSSTANNIINWISVLTIRWCPCMKLPLVFLEDSVCYHQCILLAKLLASVLFHFVLQDLICLFLQVSLYFLLLHSNPLKWKWHLFFFFGVSSKKVL